MPRNDDGEFELILGNKQLLSVFFIVVILLGVFFAMGYIVGRSSGPAEAAKRNQAGDAAAPARTDAQSSMPAATTQTLVEPVTKTVETPAPTPPVERTIKAAAVSASAVTEPVAGQIYVQVLALGKPEAEVLAEVLAKKGFHATVAPGPNDRLFRVLVGPVKDAGDAGKIKGDLEQAGFKGAFPKKF